MPRSLLEWAGLSGAAVAASAVAIVTFGTLLNATPHPALGAVAALLLTLPAALLVRNTAARYAVWGAWSWIVTMTLLGLVILGDAAIRLI